MSVLTEVLDAVVTMAQAAGAYATITIGALPADNGICMTYASGSTDALFMDKGACLALPVVLNGKHSLQTSVCGALEAIHMALTRASAYPTAAAWQITNIETISTPSYLDRQANQWLYGSSLRIKIYIPNT